MSFLELIKGNGFEVIFSLVAANLIAQALKTLVYAMQHKEMNLYLMISTGGMPSSHSASVMAMTTSVGLIEGFDSVAFAISLAFSVVVMYDAAGVRRAAGKQARVLNAIVQELLSKEHTLNTGKLKEFLGHTPKEVFVGALLGIAISFGLHLLILNGG